MSLDLSARRLYYAGIDIQGSALYSMDYMGSDIREHYRLSLFRSVYGLGVFSGNVYWINFARGSDIIYQASLNYTSIDQVVLLKRVERVSLIV